MSQHRASEHQRRRNVDARQAKDLQGPLEPFERSTVASLGELIDGDVERRRLIDQRDEAKRAQRGE
jgi:hypothetical protein